VTRCFLAGNEESKFVHGNVDTLDIITSVLHLYKREERIRVYVSVCVCTNSTASNHGCARTQKKSWLDRPHFYSPHVHTHKTYNICLRNGIE